MATKSKKKRDSEPAKTKATPAVGVAAKSHEPKKKEKIHHSQVTNKVKKKVSKKHPLAKINKKHPSKSDVEVDDSIDDVLEDNDILESDVEENFNVEALSDQSVSPSEDSDMVMALSDTSASSTLTLEVPQSQTFSQASYKFVSMPDGTQRVAITLGFDDIFRADDYEVRISS